MNGLSSLSAPERKLEYDDGIIRRIRKTPSGIGDEKYMDARITLVGRRPEFSLKLPYKNNKSGLEPFSDGQRVRLYSEEGSGPLVRLIGLESLSNDGVIFDRACKPGYVFD